MCTSSDSGSSGFWKDAALILGASMLLNRKQENSSEDSSSCDNPISLIIECFDMIKLLLIDPIIWAFGVVREAPSLLGKIFYFFVLLLSAPAYYAFVEGGIYSGTYWRIFLLDLYILEDCLWSLIATFSIHFPCSRYQYCAKLVTGGPDGLSRNYVSFILHR